MSNFIFYSCVWIFCTGVGLLFPSRFGASATAPEAGTLYLQRGYGGTLIATVILILLYNNTWPSNIWTRLTTLFKKDQGQESSDDEAAAAAAKSEAERAKHAHRTTVALTFYHALMAFYTYTLLVRRSRRIDSGSAYGPTVTCAGNSLLFFWRVLALLFAGEGKVSKTTGADKRTSNFPFSNRDSARSRKKEFRAMEKGKGEHRL